MMKRPLSASIVSRLGTVVCCHTAGRGHATTLLSEEGWLGGWLTLDDAAAASSVGNRHGRRRGIRYPLYSRSGAVIAFQHALPSTLALPSQHTQRGRVSLRVIPTASCVPATAGLAHGEHPGPTSATSRSHSRQRLPPLPRLPWRRLPPCLIFIVFVPFFPAAARRERAPRELDGVLVVNRIKPHTDFKGMVGSGLMKMLVVGLGKREGASAFHRSSLEHGYETILRAHALVGFIEDLRLLHEGSRLCGFCIKIFQHTCFKHIYIIF